ncbi:MAG: non-heme iron oxygenase ferredoxin subunit [Actinobacteria bacterium]|nr:non-heme iron oxygenase ferredoxin subunit [Actinomycetota bacterium]
MSDSNESPKFIRACRLVDVPVSGSLKVDLEGTSVAIVRTAEGVFAILDACSHADVLLSEGEVEGCTIECWLHGSQFDLRTGAPLTLPAVVAVPVYEVRLSGEGDDTVVEVAASPTDFSARSNAVTSQAATKEL